MVVKLGGALDALHRIVARDPGSLISALAPHQGTHKGRCVNIACAVAGIGQLIVLVVAVLLAFLHHNTGLAFLVGNAGEDHILTAQSLELGQDLVDVSPVILGLILHAGHETGLGDIGDHKIRLAAQALHSLHKFHVKAGIQIAVIRHGRIHDLDSLGANRRKNIGNIIDLLGAAQVTGVDGVKSDAFLHPMILNGGHILGQIPEGVAGETGSMGGQNGRGQYTGLHAAGRDDRQRYSQRALAHTGNILDSQNLLIIHENFSFFTISAPIVPKTGCKSSANFGP